MSTIFTKKYSGKIKRMISEGQICPSSLPELYIKKTKQTEVDTSKSESLFPSKIFNILSKKTSTEITSNTLALKITDKVFNNTPYYYKLNQLPLKEDLELIEENYVIDNQTLYLNTTKKYIQIGYKMYTVVPVIGLDVWNRDKRVSIRKLKDRFKITIKSNTDLQIELLTRSLLTPIVYNNWISFNDCVSKFNSKDYVYLYTHSFEYYDKVEIHEKTLKLNLRDLPIGDVSIEDLGDYLKVMYKTFRSNMQINNDLNTNLFLKIEVNDQGTAQLKTAVFNKNSDFILKIINHKTHLEYVEANPYILAPLYKHKSEVYYFTWETTTKYATDMNTPIGCERIVLDLDKLLDRRVPSYILEDGSKILDDNYEVSVSDLNTTQYKGNTNLNHLTSIFNLV